MTSFDVFAFLILFGIPLLLGVIDTSSFSAWNKRVFGALSLVAFLLFLTGLGYIIARMNSLPPSFEIITPAADFIFGVVFYWLSILFLVGYGVMYGVSQSAGGIIVSFAFLGTVIGIAVLVGSLGVLIMMSKRIANQRRPVKTIRILVGLLFALLAMIGITLILSTWMSPVGDLQSVKQSIEESASSSSRDLNCSLAQVDAGLQLAIFGRNGPPFVPWPVDTTESCGYIPIWSVDVTTHPVRISQAYMSLASWLSKVNWVEETPRFLQGLALLAVATVGAFGVYWIMKKRKSSRNNTVEQQNQPERKG